MIFVTGGCFQGKQQWVLQNCQVQPFRVADGAVCSMEAIKSAGVLDHFHLLVRRWMQAGKIPADETEKILSDNPIFFVINSYTTGLQPAVLSYIMDTEITSRFGGCVIADEIGLPVKSNGLVFPCGASARWK